MWYPRLTLMSRRQPIKKRQQDLQLHPTLELEGGSTPSRFSKQTTSFSIPSRWTSKIRRHSHKPNPHSKVSSLRLLAPGSHNPKEPTSWSSLNSSNFQPSSSFTRETRLWCNLQSREFFSNNRWIRSLILHPDSSAICSLPRSQYSWSRKETQKRMTYWTIWIPPLLRVQKLHRPIIKHTNQ